MEHANADLEVYELEADVEDLRERVLFLTTIRNVLMDAISKVHGMKLEPKDKCMEILDSAIKRELEMSEAFNRGDKP